MRIVTLLLLLAFSPALLAQKISGSVTDETGGAVAGAVIGLFKQGDSGVVKWVIADQAGLYSFSDCKPGIYYLSATMVGHMPVFSDLIICNNTDITIPELVIPRLVGKFKTVMLPQQKPMIEINAGKSILNVDCLINANGTDYLELSHKCFNMDINFSCALSLLQ